MTPRIAIIGTGAMGSVYAAHMAEAGYTVHAVDPWAAHVEAINSLGLRIEGPKGDRVVRNIRAATDIAALPPCDLYVIATKASGVADAAKALAQVMPPEALVLTIQNGLGAGERIAAHLPVGQVMLGVADGFGASMRGPGHAHHNAMKLIRLGEMPGGMTDRLRALEALWAGAGFTARAFEDINLLIWEKFLCNVASAAPCTLFDCTVGTLRQTPEWWDVAVSCAREAFAVGRAEGIRFAFDDPVEHVSDFLALMPDASPSMRLDHLARRPSEIDAINGMVPLVGARHGIAAPVNAALSALVRRAEARFAPGNPTGDANGR